MFRILALEILLVAHGQVRDDIDIVLTPLNNNPGFLPYFIGYAKIQRTQHAFLHYYELNKIHRVIENLKYQAYTFTEHITSKESNFTQQYMMYNQFLGNNLESMVKKENSIMTSISNRYQKIEGDDLKYVKAISGNLDIIDFVEYDRSISVLKRNYSLENQRQQAASWNNPVLGMYNDTMSKVIEDMDKMNEIIARRIQMIDVSNTTVNDTLNIRSVFYELKDNCERFLNFLAAVEDEVVSYSRPYVSHQLLTQENAQYIIDVLLNIYNPAELLVNNNTYVEDIYNILEYGSYYIGDTLVFATRLPVAYRQLFSFFRIYPIPTYKDAVLIPPKPYMAMRGTLYQYMDNECKNIGGIYFCQEQMLLDGDVQPDCVHRVLRQRNALLYMPSYCMYTAIVASKEIWQMLDEGRHFFYSSSYTTIVTVCHGRKNQLHIGGPYLVTIPRGCKVYSSDNIVENEQDHRRGRPVALQSFIMTNITVKNEDRPLILEDVPLELIFYVNEFLDKIKVVSMPTQVTNLYWLVWFLGFLVLSRFLYCFFKIVSIKHVFFPKRNTKCSKKLLIRRTSF